MVKDAVTQTYKYLMGKKVEDLTFHEKLLRISIANWACKYGVTECVEMADELFHSVLRDEIIDVDLKPAVYCHGLRTSTGNWYTMFEKFNFTNFATEQATLMTALGCSKRESDIYVRNF